VARAAGAAQEEALEAERAVAAGRDEPHWAFPVFTVFSIITTLLLIYVFCAQAFGPNLSLTQFSWGGYDMDLPWIGKIANTRNATAGLVKAPPSASAGTTEVAEEAAEEEAEAVEEEEAP
jgi:hypothetical protein